MIWLGFGIASLLAPVHWIVLMLIVVAIAMPRYIPPTARLIARGMRAMRKTSRSRHSVRRSLQRIQGDRDPQFVEPTSASASLWLGALIAASAAAVLSWWLLRPR